MILRIPGSVHSPVDRIDSPHYRIVLEIHLLGTEYLGDSGENHSSPTGSSFCTTGPELKHHLEGTNPLGDYLVSNTLEVAEKYMRDKAWSRCIWDVTAVAWLLNDGQRFLRTRRVPTPIPQYDFTYSVPEDARPMEYVYRINRDKLFSDLFERIARL